MALFVLDQKHFKLRPHLSNTPFFPAQDINIDHHNTPHPCLNFKAVKNNIDKYGSRL